MEFKIIAWAAFLLTLSLGNGVVILETEAEVSRLQAVLQGRNNSLEILKGRLQLILTFLQEEKSQLETTDAALPEIVSQLIRRPNQRNLRLQRVLNVGLKLSNANRRRRSAEDSSEEWVFDTQQTSFAELLKNRRDREEARLRSILQQRLQKTLAFISRINQLLSSVDEKIALNTFALENLSTLVESLIFDAPQGRIDLLTLLTAAEKLRTSTTTTISTTAKEIETTTMKIETTTSEKPEATTRDPALQQRIDEEIIRLRQVLMRRITRIQFLINSYNSPFLQNFYLAKLDFLSRTLDNLTILVAQLVTSPTQRGIRLSELLRASRNLPTVIIGSRRRRRRDVTSDGSPESMESAESTEDSETDDRKKRSTSWESAESGEEVNEVSLDDIEELLNGIITDLKGLDDV